MASSEEDINKPRSVKVKATFEYKGSDQIESNWDNPKQQAVGKDALVYKGFFKGTLNETIDIALKRYQIVGGKRGKDIAKEIENNLQVLSSDKNKHPNLVRYFGHATDANFRYVATELCKCSVVDIVEYPAAKNMGKTTKPGMNDKLFGEISSSLPSKEIFRQSLEAVSFLHGLEMIHRNLHPNNFLISCIDEKKSYYLVKLTDFHLSKRLENNLVENTGTFNKKGWFAPESCNTNNTLSDKVDSFILGLYYFYILSGGKHPFGKGVYTDQVPGIKNSGHGVYKPNWDGKPDLAIDVVYGEEARRALQLIKDLIKYEPKDRKSVDDALKSSYFQMEPYNIYNHPSSSIPGLCVIICQEKYHNPKDDVDYISDYSNNQYEGIGLDAKKLEQTFKSFGYDILSYKNLRAIQIKDVLSSTILEYLAKRAGKSLKNYASLIVCLLGHGDKGVVLGADGVPVSLNTIQYDAFNDQACPDLKGKPKIFIVLACQGNKQQNIQNERSNHSASMDVSVDADEEFMAVPYVVEDQSLASPINRPSINRPQNAVQENLPPVYDFIRLVSTIEEYQSRFNYGTGSVFIQSFCEALKNEYNEEYKEDDKPEVKEKNKRDLTQLFTEFVIPTVGRSGGNVKQTPEFRSSLVKTIRFRLQQNHGTPLQHEYNGEKHDKSFHHARNYRKALLPNYKKKKIGYEHLLKTVYGEAKDEPKIVQRAIAWVIFNRYKKLYRPEWGVGNMRRVCMSTDQFKCWLDKEDIVMSDTAAKNAIELWLPKAFDDESPVDPTHGAICYFNKPVDKSVTGNLVNTIDIGSYKFYK